MGIGRTAGTIGLVLGGLLISGLTVGRLVLPTVNDFPRSRASFTVSEETPATTDLPVATTLSDLARQFRQLRVPIRDPFRPRSEKRSTAAPQARRSSPAVSVRKGESMRLEAITVEPTGRWAIINGTIVQEGDWISGYRVLDIRPESVRLIRGQNSLRLTF